MVRRQPRRRVALRLFGGLAALCGLLQRLPGDGLRGDLRRAGVRGRAAHGTGLPRLQFARQKPGLAEVIAVLRGGIGGLRPAAVRRQPLQLPLLHVQRRFQPLDLAQHGQAILHLLRLRQQRVNLPAAALRFLHARFGLGQRLFRLFKRRLRLGQRRPLRVHIPPGAPHQRLVGFKLLRPARGRQRRPLRVDLALPGRQRRQTRLFAFPIREIPVDALAFGHGGNQRADLVGGFLFLRPGLLLRGFFLRNQPRQQRAERVGMLNLAAVAQQNLPLGKFRFRVDLPFRAQNDLFERLLFVGAGAVFLLQAALQIDVEVGVKQIPKELLAIVGGRGENLQKIALRDHHRLRKLILRQPQQLAHAAVDVIHAQNLLAGVLVAHLRVGRLPGGRLHPVLFLLRRALVFEVAPNPPRLPAVPERQLDVGFRLIGDVIRMEGFAFSLLLAAGGLAVERKADRVEDRRLARAGVARD